MGFFEEVDRLSLLSLQISLPNPGTCFRLMIFVTRFFALHWVWGFFWYVLIVGVFARCICSSILVVSWRISKRAWFQFPSWSFSTPSCYCPAGISLGEWNLLNWYWEWAGVEDSFVLLSSPNGVRFAPVTCWFLENWFKFLLMLLCWGMLGVWVVGTLVGLIRFCWRSWLLNLLCGATGSSTSTSMLFLNTSGSSIVFGPRMGCKIIKAGYHGLKTIANLR